MPTHSIYIGIERDPNDVTADRFAHTLGFLLNRPVTLYIYNVSVDSESIYLEVGGKEDEIAAWCTNIVSHSEPVQSAWESFQKSAERPSPIKITKAYCSLL